MILIMSSADSSDSDMDPVEVRRQSQLPPSSASPQSDRTTGTPPRGKPLLRPIGVNQLYVDLGDWAPAADPSKLAPSPNYAHLPPPPSIVSSRSSNSAVDAARAPSTPSPQAVSNVAPTSHPNSHLTPLQLSISHSLSRLLSLDIFRTFIATPVGYSQFHAYLSTTSSPTTSSPAATLELYRDLSVLKTLALRSGVASRGIRDVYLIPDSEKHVETPLPAMKEMVSALRGVISGAQGLEKPATRLLEQLYANEFEGFVKYRLLRYTSVQLGKYGVEAGERKGL